MHVKAMAIAGPIAAGSDMFFNMRTNPINVPMPPLAKLYAPANCQPLMPSCNSSMDAALENTAFNMVGILKRLNISIPMVDPKTMIKV